MKFILVATNNSPARDVIRSCFDPEYEIQTVTTYNRCMGLFVEKRYEYLFFDIALLPVDDKTSDFKDFLKKFWQLYPSLEIIILCSPQLIRKAVQAVKAGASDYLTFPLDPVEVRLVIETIDKTILVQSELDYLRDKFWRSESHAILRTNSPGMREVFNKVRSVSQSDSTILLLGETGTGKGVLANLIHQHSKRRDHQFISVHCGAIPDTLLESELFGHEKGAFTGAVRRKLGKFEIAQGGTIFLDEIGTISPAMQIKLLQVLQDRNFQRVGGEASIPADVRIIAATNADLEKMRDEGAFRADLYYRLDVFPIQIPPLRERLNDIPLLIDDTIKRLNRFNNKNIRGFSTEVLQAMQRYSWPGNIRELENIVERAYIIEKSAVLSRESFPVELFEQSTGIDSNRIDTDLTLREIRDREIAVIESNYLQKLLAKKSGRIKQTAAAAGIGVRQLHKLMTKYGLKKDNFKKSEF